MVQWSDWLWHTGIVEYNKPIVLPAGHPTHTGGMKEAERRGDGSYKQKKKYYSGDHRRRALETELVVRLWLLILVRIEKLLANTQHLGGDFIYLCNHAIPKEVARRYCG